MGYEYCNRKRKNLGSTSSKFGKFEETYHGILPTTIVGALNLVALFCPNLPHYWSLLQVFLPHSINGTC
jgi:hypothetical protein